MGSCWQPIKVQGVPDAARRGLGAPPSYGRTKCRESSMEFQCLTDVSASSLMPPRNFRVNNFRLAFTSNSSHYRWRHSSELYCLMHFFIGFYCIFLNVNVIRLAQQEFTFLSYFIYMFLSSEVHLRQPSRTSLLHSTNPHKLY